MAKERSLKILKVADLSAGTKLAAKLFAEAADSSPDQPVGLATGGTMDGVYRELAKSHFIPACKDAFALDEYEGIARDHKNAYASELRHKFAENLGWSGTLHVPGQGPYSGESGAAAFERAIADLGPISVQLLGLGVNGHIAFNEPGSPFDSTTRRVELHSDTIKANSVYFDDPASIPDHAITQGLATIGQSSKLLLLVFGPAKKAALSAALKHPDLSTPLAAFANHGDLVLITDLDY
jgi:glucosamine-6-phosphate deaminase